MAEKTKRFWWLKLREDFFDQTAMKKLRRMAGGDTFTIIYLKMQLLSLRNEGVIPFEGVEDSFEEELSLRLDESTEDVQMTVLFLKKHGLLEEMSGKEHLLPEAVKNMASESDSAARMRNLRDRKKQQDFPPALQCDGEASHCSHTNVTCDTEKRRGEKEKSKRETTTRVHARDEDASNDQTGERLPVQTAKGSGEKPVDHATTRFDEFWKAYPRKAGKGAAVGAWKKIKPDKALFEKIIQALSLAVQCDQWQRDNGQFIPYPATWLNQRRWEDEYTVPATQSAKNSVTRNYDSEPDFLEEAMLRGCDHGGE